MPAPEGADAAPIPARLIIRRKPAAAAARAQAKAVRKAARQGYAAQPRQIEAAAHFMVMTTLPQDTMPADAVCALYRLRWQIELAFKRLKSLMGLEEIDAREPRLAKAAVCAKLILAILAESLLGRVLALSPTADRPPSLWRLARLLHQRLTAALLDAPALAAILGSLARLRRAIAEPPRRRAPQPITVLTTLS